MTTHNHPIANLYQPYKKPKGRDNPRDTRFAGPNANPSWIQTWTGRRFWSFEAKPEDIDIYDIAHTLSVKTRFTGHTEFYSIAQHCCLVCDHAADDIKLESLLHDATEAYLPDIPSPYKRLFFVEMPDGKFLSFSTAEHLLYRAIATSFNLPHCISHSIKLLDQDALATERRDLLIHDVPWPCLDAMHCKPWPERIEPWSPQLAEDRFLELFYTHHKPSI